MEKPTPVVYLLHGEDEFSIAQFLSEFEQKLGDASLAAMNITRLDGRSLNLDELPTVANAMPFLTKRRLVILSHPLARLEKDEARQKFKTLLEKIPPTTALVLVEYHLLVDDRDPRRDRTHWLIDWALKSGDRVYIQAFPQKKGPALVSWIESRTKTFGGQITHDAALQLASLVGDENRLADEELQKLLAYVNYRRPIDLEDVLNLTVDSAEGDVFTLVDAIGNRDARRAMGMLHRLLEEQESQALFAMVIRQFRLLILAREALDSGLGDNLPRAIGVAPFVAKKLVPQVQRFSIQDLEEIYHHILNVDESIKSGLVEDVVALDTLVAALTNPA